MKLSFVINDDAEPIGIIRENDLFKETYVFEVNPKTDFLVMRLMERVKKDKQDV
jgi:hypothetical protein